MSDLRRDAETAAGGAEDEAHAAVRTSGAAAVPHRAGPWANRLKKAVHVLALACFPLSLASPGATVGLALVGLYGLVVWKRAGAPADIKRVGSFALALYLPLVFIDVLNGGGIDNFRLTAIDYLPLLALVPFAVAVRHVGASPNEFDRAMQLTILLALASSILQWAVFGVVRPGGLNLNPIPYGFVVMMWSTVLLARGLWRGRAGAASTTVALLGAVVILLTGSKLALGCLVVSFGLVGTGWARAQRKWKTFGVTAGLLAIVLATATVLLAGTRVTAFLNELGELAETGASKGTSVGHRLELAGSGFRAFLDHPWIGYGFAERMDAAFAHASLGGPDVTMHDHLHNDYVTHLVSYGIFGLVFLLLYLAFYLRQARRAEDSAYRTSGAAITVAIALYMGFEIAFNMDPISGAMAIHLGLLVALSSAAHRPERQNMPGGDANASAVSTE